MGVENLDNFLKNSRDIILEHRVDGEKKFDPLCSTMLAIEDKLRSIHLTPDGIIPGSKPAGAHRPGIVKKKIKSQDVLLATEGDSITIVENGK